MDLRITDALRLLQDEDLIWSDDFEAIRKPLAALLRVIEQLPTHQLDDAVEQLLDGLLAEPMGYTPDLDAVATDTLRQVQLYDALVSTDRTANAIKRLFKLL